MRWWECARRQRQSLYLLGGQGVVWGKHARKKKAKVREKPDTLRTWAFGFFPKRNTPLWAIPGILEPRRAHGTRKRAVLRQLSHMLQFAGG